MCKMFEVQTKHWPVRSFGQKKFEAFDRAFGCPAQKMEPALKRQRSDEEDLDEWYSSMAAEFALETHMDQPGSGDQVLPSDVGLSTLPAPSPLPPVPASWLASSSFALPPCRPPQASTACEAQPQTESEIDLYIAADPVYRVWVPPLKKMLEPLLESRGKQLRPLVVGSICSGTQPYKMVLKLFEVDHRSSFACDSKAAAQKFWFRQLGP